MEVPNAIPLHESRFSFAGRGSEYFAIWVVNLLLSIITLGIYSAWAKVRREQYFHRNTLFDGQPFDYTGKPVNILIGRILALVVIAAGSALQKINMPIALAVTAFFALIYPWAIVRSMKFRARNTRYRNLAFRFTGTTLEAAKVYFWIYVAIIPFVLMSIFLSPQLQAMGGEKQSAEALRSGPMIWLGVAMGLTVVLFAVLWPIYQCRMQSFLHRHVRYGSAQGDFDGSVGDFYRALLRALGVSLIVLVAMIAIGAAAALLHFPLLIGLIYFLLLIPQAAYTVNIINTTYRYSALGGQRFFSDMKIGSYALLAFTNLLLLVVSLGFAWPWIKVRMARYRCEHLALMINVESINTIVGETSHDVAAFGEEVAEFLDFDISL